jgi:hypothetical protein
MPSPRVACTTVIGCLLWIPTFAAGQGSARTSDPVAALVGQLDSAWNRKDTVAVGRLLASRHQYFT